MYRLSSINSSIKLNGFEILNKIGTGATSIVYDAKLNGNGGINSILYKSVESPYNGVDLDDILIMKQENKITNTGDMKLNL